MEYWRITCNDGRNKNRADVVASVETSSQTSSTKTTGGLAHLHCHKIVHQSQNIGFNYILGFGFSRELPTVIAGDSGRNNSANKLFHLTGYCGSPRYIVLEVTEKILQWIIIIICYYNIAIVLLINHRFLRIICNYKQVTYKFNPIKTKVYALIFNKFNWFIKRFYP